MRRPTVYGSDYSVYVRIVRLALEEKGVEYDLVPVDVFDKPSPEFYRQFHPFERIPAFEHEGFTLYETGAITRYVDETFHGAALMPISARERARANQIVSIADNYAYPNLVWGYYVELVSNPAVGKVNDRHKMDDARKTTRLCLDAISDLAGPAPWLVGGSTSLADLYLAPMVDYFLMAEEAREMFDTYPRMTSWWVAKTEHEGDTTERMNRPVAA